MWKEAVVAHTEVLSCHSPEELNKIMKQLSSEPMTSITRSMNTATELKLLMLSNMTSLRTVSAAHPVGRNDLRPIDICC